MMGHVPYILYYAHADRAPSIVAVTLQPMRMRITTILISEYAPCAATIRGRLLLYTMLNFDRVCLHYQRHTNVSSHEPIMGHK